MRQSVVITNNPRTIHQNQLVLFTNLGAHDVIVSGTARFAFTISLASTDADRTVVQNLGRAIVKKTTIRISGNEAMSTIVLRPLEDRVSAPECRLSGHRHEC